MSIRATVYFLLFLLWLTVLAGPALAQTSLKFKHLTVKDGLSNNYITSILQDRKGFIWFGTRNGLNKYDGYSFTAYKYRPHDSTSISHNIIFKIWEDQQGLIWIGTVEGGICKFDPATEQFTTYHPPQPKNSFLHPFRAVSAINEDREGMLWVGNFGGELRRFNKKTGQFSEPYVLNYQPSKDESNWGNDGINTIYKDRTGTLWVGNRAGIHKLSLTPTKEGASSDVRFQPYQHDPKNPNSLSSNFVTSIFEDQKGLLWIGTSNHGLNRFDPKTGVFTRYQHDPNNPRSLSSNSMWFNSATQDARGNLWFGTRNGLNQLNREQTGFTRYEHDPGDANSLGDNYVTSLFMDHAGSLWVGTSTGVSRIDAFQLPFRSYGYRPAPTNSRGGSSVSALYEDKEGILWIATEKRLDSFDPKTGRFSHYEFPATLPSLSSQTCIVEDHRATFWVSSGDKLMRFNPKTGEFQSSGSPRLDQQLANQWILTLYEDHQGRLWIGSLIGLRCFDAQTGTVREYLHDPANPQTISDHVVTAIREDKAGNLWIGHESNGLSKLNRTTGRFTRYQHRVNDSTSLSSNSQNCIYRDAKGALWIGTVGGGLCRFNEPTQTFTTFTQKQGLANNTINAIQEDNQGNLWLNTSHGLSRFSPTTHTFTNYDEQDGLQSNQLSSAAWKGSDGTLYVGSDNGFNGFKPEDIRLNRYVSPVVITRFRLFDKVLPGKSEAAEIELSYQQNFISFEYAALNYTNPQKNQYRYQLEGVDPDWVQAGTRRMASYTDLDPGDYVFRVKGSNNDGVWNERGTSLRILIHPPWWRTGWFISLVAAIGVGLVYGGMRYRIAQVRQEEAQKAEFTRKLSEMEMQALRAQMNPHFIFNSLNSINTFILKNEPEAASEYLAKFSRLIRLILQNSSVTVVTLDSELEALRLYLEMESLRFRNKFTYQIELDPNMEADEVEIPPLLIQPYVENAIWHGLMHKEGVGHIAIDLQLADNVLVCNIEDDGVGRKRAAELKSKSATKSKSLGMQITAHRIKLINDLHGKQTTLQIVDLVDASGEACGTRVTLNIAV